MLAALDPAEGDQMCCPVLKGPPVSLFHQQPQTHILRDCYLDRSNPSNVLHLKHLVQQRMELEALLTGHTLLGLSQILSVQEMLTEACHWEGMPENQAAV